MSKTTAENVVNQLILEGKILPEHKEEMVQLLDEELRKSSKRHVRKIAQEAINLAYERGILRAHQPETDA